MTGVDVSIITCIEQRKSNVGIEREKERSMKEGIEEKGAKEKSSKEKECLVRCLLPENQMSEAFINSMFLALSGGLQDAYTYNCRGGVFSNAQTGNVVLMSQNLMAGNWMAGLKFFIPLLAFTLGVFVAESVQHKFRYAKKLHWRQGILLTEILLLAAVGWMPEAYNMAATSMVSFACAMQVQTFRKVSGFSYASTMCIGNLRSGTAALSVYLRERSPKHLKQAGYYFGIILAFAVGAGIGGIVSVAYGMHVIWISCVLLFISFLLMSLETFR